ncbi:MAG: hydroxymethylbilane synthase [Tepidisphaerales bacterium]
MSTGILRMGARGSMLSRMQSATVVQMLETAHPGLKVQTIIVKTTGDQVTDKPLHEFGGKGLFTKELEQALIRGEIDFAVHSFKDVPTTQPLVDTSGLCFGAVPAREDVRDVLVCAKARSLAELAPGAKVGTGSLRRQCQILARYPELKVEMIRGNVDTRVKKMKTGEYDAVILAFAGLKRSGLFDESCMAVIDVDEMLPSAGQGALCLQCRLDDQATIDLLQAVNDPAASTCVEVEREVVALLNGDCHSPIAVLAANEEGQVVVKAAVGRKGGLPPVIRVMAAAPLEEALSAAQSIHQQLIMAGVERMLM